MTSLPETFSAFDAELRRILTDAHSSERASEAASLVTGYTQRGHISDFLMSIRADGGLIAQCARASTKHPLGFDKFTLHTTDRYTLRLHIWWPGENRAMEHIHNHRFSFASAVILGNVNIEIYREATGGEMYECYEESKDRERYSYRSRGHIGVEVASLFSLRPGSAYYLGSTDYHRVRVVDKGVSATVFIELPKDHSGTDILVGADQEPPMAGYRTPMNVDEAQQRLLAFADVLMLGPGNSASFVIG